MKDLKIDPEFESMCRPLSEDEFACLESQLIVDGCMDAIKVWNGFIIDGHNRYKICNKHKIDYRIVNTSFDDRKSVLLWILDNQLGRRNLSDLDRVALLEKKRPILEAQAKERQGARTDIVPNLALSTRPAKVRDQLAKEAGVSHGTYDKLVRINKQGTEELKSAVRKKKISVSAAATIATQPNERQPELVAVEVENRKSIPKKITKEMLHDASPAMMYAESAIDQLKKIQKSDIRRTEAFKHVGKWIEETLKQEG
jgi:hypothetical protein